MTHSLAGLEARVRSRICRVCFEDEWEGPCGLDESGECALFRFFPEVAHAVEATHSGNLQDYAGAIHRDVCAKCAAHQAGSVCGLPQRVHCALYAYLPQVVESIAAAPGTSYIRTACV